MSILPLGGDGMSFLNFLISSRLDTIKQKFIALYILNVADILFTLFLLSTGMVDYRAPVIYEIKDNNFFSILIKCVITLLLLILEITRVNRSVEKHLMLSNAFITFCLAAYFIIDISHTIWCFKYLIFQKIY